MTDILRIGHNDLLDEDTKSLAASISAADTDYSVDNIADLNCAKVYRSDDASSALGIVQDFGSAVTVNFVAVINHNFRNTATLKIQANSSDAWTSPAFEQTISLTSGEYNSYAVFSDVSYQYWRLYVDDTGNPDGYYQIGKWYIGTHTAFDIAFDWPYDNRTQYNNLVHVTEWNEKYVYGREERKIYEVSWTNSTDSEISDLEDVFEAVEGQKYPFVFVPNDSNTLCYYMRFAQDNLTLTKRFNANDVRISLEEESRGLDI